MRRLLAVRVVTWYGKLLTIAAVWLVGFLAIWLLPVAGVPLDVARSANTVLTLVGIFLAARWFRGKGEPIAPPRPWWQMTARRPLSLIIGIVMALAALGGVVEILRSGFGIQIGRASSSTTTLAEAVDYLVFNAIVAAAYLNSARRLPRPTPKPKEPRLTFRPLR